MRQPTFHLDFETRSTVDIKKVGGWAYAMHPTTEIVCMAYHAEGEKTRIITGQQLKTANGITPPKWGFDGYNFVAFNAQFEYAVWNFILHKRYGWPALWEPSRWRCTMAQALAAGLPSSLEKVGSALRLPIQKDLNGRAAMLKLCRPIGVDALGDPVYNEDPILKETTYQYCMRDVDSEMEIEKALPPLTEAEQKIWELDLTINLRGVPVDVETAKLAAATAKDLTADLNQQLTKLTGGAVDKASRIAAIKNWMASKGLKVQSLNKEAMTNLLSKPHLLPKGVQEVLKIRRQVGKSSTAKYEATVRTAGPDGRVRGVLQYHAAHTGRWGGRLIQPQNYPQGFGVEEQEIVLDILREENPGEDLQMIYGDKSMEALSNTLRGTICASPGKVFIGADYNAIEARTLFWLANDEAALSMYHRGESPYVDMARYIFDDKTITKKTHHKEYDLGKRAILGCGYGMGWEKFMGTVKTQAGYDVSPELAKTAVDGYRTKYASVPRLWKEVEHAAVAAVLSPGSVQTCAAGGRVAWGMSKGYPDFLVCRLPSGRYLWYYRPIVKLAPTPWGEPKQTLFYERESPTTHQWGLEKTYGGALVENVTQAVARDVMANGMQNCEAAGFPIVLTVHDEDLSEVNEDAVWQIDQETQGARTAVDEFVDAMCTLPAWAKGLPLAAEGWIGKRYRK